MQGFLAMIASKGSLTHLSLRSIILTGGSWRIVLSLLATEYRNLTSFKFDRLREEEGVMSGEDGPLLAPWTLVTSLMELA